jgi:hypothetical protein
MAQKYGRIKQLEDNHRKNLIFRRNITHYDSTIAIEKL